MNKQQKMLFRAKAKEFGVSFVDFACWTLRLRQLVDGSNCGCSPTYEYLDKKKRKEVKKQLKQRCIAFGANHKMPKTQEDWRKGHKEILAIRRSLVVIFDSFYRLYKLGEEGRLPRGEKFDIEIAYDLLDKINIQTHTSQRKWKELWENKQKVEERTCDQYITHFTFSAKRGIHIKRSAIKKHFENWMGGRKKMLKEGITDALMYNKLSEHLEEQNETEKNVLGKCGGIWSFKCKTDFQDIQ